MDIKPYDIVEFNGERERVMRLHSYKNEARITSYGWVNKSALTLLEPFDNPIFNVGDKVLIKPIGYGDRDEYSAGWGWEMNELINTQSTVTEVDDIERVCKLANGYWFATYHLENLNEYDMI